MHVKTRGGVFGPQGRGGGIFDGSQMGFGAVPYEQAALGIGLGVVSGLGQPPATCPTTDISPDAAEAYKKCRANAYYQATLQCKNYPGPMAECVTPNFYANFNAADCFRYCAEKCTDKGPIKVVQDELSRPITGIWVGEDQAALEASGQSFLDLAPGCKGDAPYAQPPAKALPAPPPPVTEPEPVFVPKKTGISTAWIVGGLLVAAAAAGVAVAMKKKKG
jgi:hypothetical protein